MTTKQIEIAKEIAKQNEFLESVHLALILVQAMGVSFEDAMLFVGAQS